MSTRRSILLGTGLLLVGILVGVAGAQALQVTRYLNTGLFTVGKGEGLDFHVSIDDQRAGQPARVVMRIFDRFGAVVSEDTATIQAGESTTLRMSDPGDYRAHAQVVDSPGPQSERRQVLGMVEVFNIDDLTIDRTICPQIHDEPQTGNRP